MILVFFELLEISNESKIHVEKIKALMTEIHKFLNDLSPSIMNYIFQKWENHYFLKNQRSLAPKRKFTITYGIDTTSFSGPQIWQDPPQDIKNSNSWNLFKSYIKKIWNLNFSLQDM